MNKILFKCDLDDSENIDEASNPPLAHNHGRAEPLLKISPFLTPLPCPESPPNPVCLVIG